MFQNIDKFFSSNMGTNNNKNQIVFIRSIRVLKFAKFYHKELMKDDRDQFFFEKFEEHAFHKIAFGPVK